MNKINIVILVFLTIAYAETNAMGKFGQKESGARRPSPLEQVDLSVKVMGSFELANEIKNSFLELKDFDKNMREDEKISIITAQLKYYQVVHELFIHNKFLCNPKNLSSKYLLEYCFCNTSMQDKFQAKTDSLLGGYVLDLHQWFEEMRSTEYQVLLIPYRLING